FSNDYITNTAPRNFVNRVINAKVDYNILQNLILGAHFANVQDKQDVPSYFTQYNTENNQSDLNLKWKFTPNQNILVGATYNDANYKTSSIKNQDQSVNSTGYYLQHQFKNELFDTQVGLRVEDNELFGSHTVGQGAIRYHFLPNASVYANIGSAFRAPTLNELYSQWGGNENLEPEESISYELGFDYAITDNLATSFSVYRTNVDNLIVYSDSMNQNVGEANFTGGEAGLKWKQDDLFLATEYAYVETENKATGLEIAYRPKQTLTFTAGLENAVYGLSTSVIARSHANASNSANSVKVPGYATVDFNAYWNINPTVKVFTNIQNMGDVQYREAYKAASSWDNSPEDWYING
ncbi:MAG: TonB-dependent receptor, partial [Acinetobacter sp.]